MAQTLQQMATPTQPAEKPVYNMKSLAADNNAQVMANYRKRQSDAAAAKAKKDDFTDTEKANSVEARLSRMISEDSAFNVRARHVGEKLAAKHGSKGGTLMARAAMGETMDRLTPVAIKDAELGQNTLEGRMTRETQEKLGRISAGATMGAAGLSAGAAVQSAKIRAESAEEIAAEGREVERERIQSVSDTEAAKITSSQTIERERLGFANVKLVAETGSAEDQRAHELTLQTRDNKFKGQSQEYAIAADKWQADFGRGTSLLIENARGGVTLTAQERDHAHSLILADMDITHKEALANDARTTVLLNEYQKSVGNAAHAPTQGQASGIIAAANTALQSSLEFIGAASELKAADWSDYVDTNPVYT